LAKLSLWQRINANLPPRLSYSLRKSVNHNTVSGFATYDEYYIRRFGERRGGDSAGYADPHPAYAPVTRKTEPSEALQYRRFAKECLETGEPEALLAASSQIPTRLWLHPTFRLDYFIALLLVGKFKEAREFARDTLILGAFDQRSLFRMLGEAYLLDDKHLLGSIFDHIAGETKFKMTLKEEIFANNTALNYLGAEACLKHGLKSRGSSVSPDLFFFWSNLRLRRGDFAGQLADFNRALAMLGLSEIGLKSDDRALSVTNMTSPADKLFPTGPLVSIAMSTFNSAATLGPVIESLLSQTYKNIEILVIDDCSGDTTVEIATMFAQRDSRVRVFRQPQNGGTYRARNRALREAKGVFFTCNDSDDWAHPVKIEELVTPLMENEGSIATIGNLLRINEDIGIRPRQRGYVQEDQSSLCYRKDWVVQNLGFYETVPFGADSEFLSRLRAVAGDSVVRISKPLLFADWSKSSLTGSLRTGITDGGTMAAARYKYRTMYRERHAAGQFFIDLAEL
jgi:hypothetical protein